jgi:hypothetical protein
MNLVETALVTLLWIIFRGEGQIAIVWNGLRLYQSTAILSVLVGIAMTLNQIQAILHMSAYNTDALTAAYIGGRFVFFAMGVDFPQSNARFSRLV